MWSHFFLGVAIVATVQGDQPGWILVGDRKDSLTSSVAVGLLNRHTGRPAAILTLRDYDRDWVQAAADFDTTGVGRTTFQDVDDETLIGAAVSLGAVKGAILYDPAESYAIPTVVTMCGIHQALPIAGDASAAAARNLTVLDDVRTKWKSVAEATDYAISELMPLTSTKAIVLQSPGFLQNGYMSDLVAAEGLLSVWPETLGAKLPTLCVLGTKAHKQWLSILARDAASRWDGDPFPTVMGYHPTGQGVAECVALCSPGRLPLTLVSDFAANLAFHIRVPQSLPAPLPPAPQAPVYNSSKTYAALVMSDGDNLQFDMGDSRKKFDAHQKACAASGEDFCPPVAWTLSNRLLDYAPAVLNWFHTAAKEKDAFLMGPSGYGYNYPGQLSTENAKLYAKMTTNASAVLGWPGYVHWDFPGSWGKAKSYMEYLDGSALDTVLAAGVPINIVPPNLPDVIQGTQGSIAAVTQLLNWGSGNNPPNSYDDVHQVADRLKSVKPGRVTYAYIICANVAAEDFAVLASDLKGSHVELVDYRNLRSLVLQKAAFEQAVLL